MGAALVCLVALAAAPDTLTLRTGTVLRGEFVAIEKKGRGCVVRFKVKGEEATFTPRLAERVVLADGTVVVVGARRKSRSEPVRAKVYGNTERAKAAAELEERAKALEPWLHMQVGRAYAFDGIVPLMPRHGDHVAGDADDILRLIGQTRQIGGPRGGTVRVLERRANIRGVMWYRVQIGGRAGWINSIALIQSKVRAAPGDG